MKLEIFKTANGSIRIGDREDESAPLLTLEFSNEFASIPANVKFKMALAAVDKWAEYEGYE